MGNEAPSLLNSAVLLFDGKLTESYVNTGLYGNAGYGQWHGAATSANETEFVMFEFPTAKTITRYRAWYAYALSASATNVPHGFTLEGSNNGSSFTQLHTVTDLDWTTWTQATADSDIANGINCQTMDVPSNMQAPYTHYKITFQTHLEWNGGSGTNHTRLNELVLYSGHE